MNSKQSYRSKAKIYGDILSVIEEEVKCRPTKILYRANLSHDRLTKYLNDLLENDLIEKVENGDYSYYYLTDRGRSFLWEFRRFERFAKAFGITL